MFFSPPPVTVFIRILLFSALLLPRLLCGEVLPVAICKERSSIDFVVSGTTGELAGALRAFSLTLSWDATTKLPAAAHLEARLLDLHTGNEKRDAQMHLWLETSRHPVLRFDLEETRVLCGGLLHEARGHLQLHGISTPCRLVMRISKMAEGQLCFTGELFVDTRSHGLRPLRYLGICSLDPVVRVNFKIFGVVKSVAKP